MPTSTKLQSISVSQVEKYLSPTLFAGAKETKSTAAYLGKVVKNMGNMVLTKFYRFAALVSQGTWINNKTVMKRLENKFSDLKGALENSKGPSPQLSYLERGLIHTGIKEMQAICHILSQSGAKKSVVTKLQQDLNILETTNLAGAQRTFLSDQERSQAKKAASVTDTGMRRRLEKAFTEQDIRQKARAFDKQFPPKRLEQSTDAYADQIPRAADRTLDTLVRDYELYDNLETTPEEEKELQALAKAGFEARRQAIYDKLHSIIEDAFRTPKFRLSITPLAKLERQIQQASSTQEIRGYVKEATNLIKQGFTTKNKLGIQKPRLPQHFIREFKALKTWLE